MLRPRPAGARPRRAPVRPLAPALLAALALLAVVASPRSAPAQCVQTGTDVACTGTDPDGFQAAPGEDGLDLVVESGATVQNGGSGPALGLNDDSRIEVDGGSVEATGDGSQGLRIGDDGEIRQDGSVTVTGDDATGVEAGSVVDAARPDALVGSTGDISVTGARGTGVRTGNGRSVTHRGSITVDGAEGTGVELGNATVLNIVPPDGGGPAPSITVLGDDARGVVLGNSGTGLQMNGSSSISITGDRGVGIRMGDNVSVRGLSVQNTTSISVGGDDGIGVEIGDFTGGGGRRLLGTFGGQITVTGAGGRGFILGDNQNLTTLNIITVDGADGIAAQVGENSFFGTFGLRATGTNGVGAEVAGRGVLNTGGEVIGGSGGAAVRFLDPAMGETLGGRLQVQPGGVADGSASGLAVDGGSGDDFLLLFGNNMALPGSVGTIRGDVLLRGGNDAAEIQAGGVFDSALDGGAGTDVLRLSGSMGADSFDLGTPTGFEGLQVDAAGATWTLSGTNAFSEGVVLSAGEIDGSFSLGGIDESIEIATAASLLGTLDAGGGTDLATLTGTGAGSLVLDRLVGVEALRVDAAGGTWTLSGAGSFSDGVVLAAGDVAGSFALGASDDQVEIATGANLLGTLDAAGGTDVATLTGAGTGSLDLDRLVGFEQLRVDAGGGVWELSGSAPFQGDVQVLAGSIAPQGSLAVEGDLLLDAGSTLEISLGPGGAADQLLVDGALTLDPASSLVVVDAGVGLFQGDVRIFSGTSLTGGFGSVMLPPNTLTARFDFFVQGNEGFVSVRQGGLRTLGDTANRRAVGGHLDGAAAAGVGPDLQSVLDTLAGSSVGAARTIFDDLSPEVYDAHTAALGLHARAFAEVLRSPVVPCTRYRYRHHSEMRRSPSACGSGNWNPWAVPLAWSLERSGQRGRPGYDIRGAGVATGVDVRPTNDLRLNVGVAGARSGTDLADGFNASLVGVEVGAAARWRRGPLQLGGLASYGHGWHETSRRLRTLARDADSDHESHWFGVRADARWGFDLGRFELSPVARLDYTALLEDEVSESEAGDVSLELDERESHVLSSALGVELAAELERRGFGGSLLEWADGVWRPQIHARWRETWLDSDREIDARLAGAAASAGSFTVEADTPERGAEVGARLAFQPETLGTRFALGYDFFVGSQTREHQLRVELRVPLP